MGSAPFIVHRVVEILAEVVAITQPALPQSTHQSSRAALSGHTPAALAVAARASAAVLASDWSE